MKNKTIIITTLICLVPIIFGLAIYDKLPEQVPTHFNFEGEPNGYSSKAFAVFGLPLMMAFFNLLLVFALNTDPKRKNYSPVIEKISLYIMPVLSILMSALTYFKALGSNVPITSITMTFVAVLFIVIGFYMPQIKRNYTMGIKLPWTLDNDENWEKTHKLGGKLCIVAGVILFLNVFIKSIVIFVATLIIVAIVPMVYSYMIYGKTKENSAENSSF
ncbi:MAG: DUF1648 domain-containing protein [Christensenellaceae bacterium]|nr:DUF1648 domain-containing protein [Christensenellaceae bacterium]